MSQLNLNDSFTASILYDLPFGKGKNYGSNWSGAANAILGNWQVDVIERATSGFPLFVVDSADGSGVYFSYNGNTFQRPNALWAILTRPGNGRRPDRLPYEDPYACRIGSILVLSRKPPLANLGLPPALPSMVLVL